MTISKSTVLICSLLLCAALIALWPMPPTPQLLLSIFIRLLAFAIALYIVIKYREWRVIFLAAMFLLMATRQFLTLLIWLKVIERSETMRTMSEWPGCVVTLLSLVSVIYLGLILAGKAELIRKHEDSIRTLNSLLPICANCKKIKDDEGYWKEIESYIASHTDSQFTHSLCDDCANKLYGNEEWFGDMKDEEEGPL